MAADNQVAATGSPDVVQIDPNQTLKASKALLAHIKQAAQDSTNDGGKRNLLAQDENLVASETPIWLTVSTKRHIVDKARLQPGKIRLAHPLMTETSYPTICLITADPQRAYKNIVASQEFPSQLAKRITRVIGFSKIKAKYKQYEAQRKLLSEHDVFLADERIISRLPQALGKTFYKTMQKRPVPVRLEPKRSKADGKLVRTKKKPANGSKGDDEQVNAGTAAHIAKEIEKALASALVSLCPGTNAAVKIGFADWPAEHIAANTETVTAALVEKWVPQKWRNVRGVYIKGPRTPALPIWLTDELWLNGEDVVADEETEALEEAKETTAKDKGSKKRKSLDAAQDAGSPASKKKKKSSKVDKASVEGDEVLEKQIANRKATLAKQKAAAKKAMEE
ncbi:hypothetical protein CDD82_4392 [Ophiocordyceps australis]|uniref:Ribosomal protein L1 n=1 Tax=Ophiocordyceps australis TaxID=1399860 RepID=A0A2C5Z752_9HYPO|nr:hypothetical protein CDD82_4392 [Ophiocordyceps australis]